jgi:large subunit ribosomal protein L21
MKAVVKVGGKQYIVTEKETLLVDRLPEGTKELVLDVLMLVDGDKSIVGAPFVKGAQVKVSVEEGDVKGEKLRVIRYKAKKRVHKEIGHRQKYSRVTVGSITTK